MFDFDNHDYNEGIVWFTPGAYLVRLERVRQLEESGKTGKPALVAEFEVLEHQRSTETSNPIGTKPTWWHTPGNFPGARERWRNDILDFYAAVIGLDVQFPEDVAALKEKQAKKEVSPDIAAMCDDRVQKYEGALVVVTVGERKTRSGSIITTHDWSPAERGAPVMVGEKS